MEVSSYGGTATESSGLVRILKDLSASIDGEDVLIVEDIIDTGLTLNYLLRYLRGKNPATLRICTLLDKPARRLVEIPVDYRASRSPTSSSSATASTTASSTATCASSASSGRRSTRRSPPGDDASPSPRPWSALAAVARRRSRRRLRPAVVEGRRRGDGITPETGNGVLVDIRARIPPFVEREMDLRSLDFRRACVGVRLGPDNPRVAVQAGREGRLLAARRRVQAVDPAVRDRVFHGGPEGGRQGVDVGAAFDFDQHVAGDDPIRGRRADGRDAQAGDTERQPFAQARSSALRFISSS